MKELLDSYVKCLTYVSWSLRVGAGKNPKKGVSQAQRGEEMCLQKETCSATRVGGGAVVKGKIKAFFFGSRKLTEGR